MNAKCCCREATGWVLPGLGLVLLPKCPMCIAGYVAAITGMGISLPVAAGLRWAVLILCIAALTFVAVRAVARVLRGCDACVAPSAKGDAGVATTNP
jgi:hypothetical protein